ncbi:MAG: hypothetical protein IJS71_00780 [Clostridia bacterium]|nr:hypothetical protein [Clostridia bacterium]
MNSVNGSGKIIAAALAVCILLICFSSCSSENTAPAKDTTYQTEDTSQKNDEQTAPETAAVPTESKSEETEENPIMKTLTMKIDGATVAVDWEENESVAALTELVKDKPLTIQTSMYGGFEQVGQIGTSLPRNDAQTTTQAGDIVLYSGNQIVVFYGTNSWAYTRLGHITDKTAAQMKDLLGNGNVTLELSVE